MDIRTTNTIKDIWQEFGVDIEQLKSTSREKHVVEARARAVIILHDKYKFTFDKMGSIFNRGHSSIYQLYKKFKGDDFKFVYVKTNKEKPNIKSINIPLKEKTVEIPLSSIPIIQQSLENEKLLLEKQLFHIQALINIHQIFSNEKDII